MRDLEGIVKNKVLIGLQEELFLFDGGQKSFAFSTGEVKPSNQDVKNFFANFNHRSRSLNGRNIKFLHVVYPSKEVVLKNKVPLPWRDKIKSLYLHSYAYNHLCSGLDNKILYPCDLLRSIDLDRPVFRSLDSHMTDCGSMTVVQHILEQWGMEYDKDNYFSSVTEKRPGDLGEMLGVKKRVSEDFLKPKFYFREFDNRSSLLGNTNNICIVHNSESMTDSRLLVFGDSFIKFSLLFFLPVFRDVVYIRSPTFQLDMVDLISPDFVISSNAERYLCNVKADSESESMLFSHYGETGYSPPLNFREAYAAQLSYFYHSSIYRAWSNKLEVERLIWTGLGSCKPNYHIKVIDLEGNFESTGNDPFFTFSSPSISYKKSYIFEVEIWSDTESLASLYFIPKREKRFSEINKLTLPVIYGDNYLRFELPDIHLKPALRFDPVACKAMFSVNNIALKSY